MTHTRARNSWVYLVLAVSMIAPWYIGCMAPATPNPNADAPDIPPADTFVIDFSNFAGGGSDASARVAQALPGGNWVFAAASAGVWSGIITVTLAVPVGAFVESFNHEPVLQADGSWAWSYDAVVAGALYSARLEARGKGANIEWRMFISKAGEFTDVLWFTGQSNLLGTAGNWTLNRDPDNLEPFIRIDWNRNPTDQTADIRYTNIVPDGPENGGFIFYGVTGEAPFDAFYEIFNKGADRTTNIEWNRTSREGRVMDAVQFSDSDWHCWDASLQDAACDGS